MRRGLFLPCHPQANVSLYVNVDLDAFRYDRLGDETHWLTRRVIPMSASISVIVAVVHSYRHC